MPVREAVRESVRSGRRENFYTTDNGFIDNYARQLQPTDIAVYHALERYANCHTRSTWVGTAKIAEVLNVSQRTVQRSLKALEELKLIRIVQTSTVKMYFVMPLPPRPKTTATPLFDEIPDAELCGDVDVAAAPRASLFATTMSASASYASHAASTPSHTSDTRDTAYKEEQDSLNKTQEQDFFNNAEIGTIKSAKTLVNALKLSSTSMSAAIAAIEEARERRTYPSDWADPETPFAGTVSEIVVKADEARRQNISSEKFLEHFLAERSAEDLLENLGLPVTKNMTSTVTAAIKAEAAYSKLPIEKATARITSAAIDDRDSRGAMIDRFYFENVKWRSNARVSKAEQRKLDNLAANARAKEILRGQLH